MDSSTPSNVPRPILPRKWHDIPWGEWPPERCDEIIAVLPLAATEQHGPHLPPETDTMIGEAYLKEALALLPASFPVTFFPIEPVGISTEHTAFAGTRTLAPQEAIAHWLDIGVSVAQRGIRRFLMITSHGGNSAAMDIVALELRARASLLAVTTSWQRFGYPPGTFSDEEIRNGIHGGDIETSLMMAAHPEQVLQSALADFAPLSRRLEKDNRWLGTRRPAAFAWMAQDIHPSGAAGNASLATAEKGHAALAHGARGFIELLQEMKNFDIGLLSGPQMTLK